MVIYDSFLIGYRYITCLMHIHDLIKFVEIQVYLLQSLLEKEKSSNDC